jgi:hypothetical protein
MQAPSMQAPQESSVEFTCLQSTQLSVFLHLSSMVVPNLWFMNEAVSSMMHASSFLFVSGITPGKVDKELKGVQSPFVNVQKAHNISAYEPGAESEPHIHVLALTPKSRAHACGKQY